jgi:hypothetical protein
VPEHRKEVMLQHEQYEALCALAAGGLLEGAELADFLAHMKACSQCGSDYEEFSSLVTRELPQNQGALGQKFAVMKARPLPYSRPRFLRRARAEGIPISHEVETRAPSHRWYLRPAAVLAPIAIFTIAAAGLTVYHFRATPDTARANDAAFAQQIVQLQQKNAGLIASLSQLNQSLAAGQREIQNLHAQLGNPAAENLRRTSGQTRGEAQRYSSRNVQLLDESGKQEKLLAQAQDEAARSSQLRISDEASMVEQQARITELANKLRIASATLDQERQLAASGKDVRDLMASRQLHVIDVRDTDPNGNPSPAFGRVFLTEGKSLTFYAFDLNEDNNAKRGFQVWAVPGAGKNSPRSLGFLRVDAKAQGRWVLKVENPDLVKAISSVFITVEPAADGKQPSGQKMLYAYLGEANHP